MEEGDVFGCELCAFRDGVCPEVSCIDVFRTDRTEVYFERITDDEQANDQDVAAAGGSDSESA